MASKKSQNNHPKAFNKLEVLQSFPTAANPHENDDDIGTEDEITLIIPN